MAFAKEKNTVRKQLLDLLAADIDAHVDVGRLFGLVGSKTTGRWSHTVMPRVWPPSAPPRRASPA